MDSQWTKFEVIMLAVGRTRDILGENKKLNRLHDYHHTHFGDDMSSVW